MISLKNKEARFCENCKYQIWMTIQGPRAPETFPHCAHSVIKDSSGFVTTHCAHVRGNPDLCGEIGRYWEAK